MSDHDRHRHAPVEGTAIRAFFPVGSLDRVVNDDPEEGTGDHEPWEGADEPTPDPVDPGDPSPENVAFVVLGALLTLFVLARVAGFV